MLEQMTSMERVLTTLGHKEADRVPLFLLLTFHGAMEMGMSIKEYFSSGKNVAEGQLRLREKYQHDCYYPFFYAAAEIEAFGGEVIFRDDGPPNAGRPFLDKSIDVSLLDIDKALESNVLQEILQSISIIKKEKGDEAPIIGVVMSPFSVPVMQMGFPSYLELLTSGDRAFDSLMEKNEEFCRRWANAQLAAGATAICYFDPVSSPTIIPKKLYTETGLKVAQRILPQINGPTATHLASGLCLPIADELVATGTAAIGLSSEEDIGEVRKKVAGKLSIIGNLNGIAMRSWDAAEASRQVEAVLRAAGGGGGFIMADNHGEIPFQVKEDVLHAISRTVREKGCYPGHGS
jgi:uroporphyrinogen decarboxylase